MCGESKTGRWGEEDVAPPTPPRRQPGSRGMDREEILPKRCCAATARVATDESFLPECTTDHLEMCDAASRSQMMKSESAEAVQQIPDFPGGQDFRSGFFFCRIGRS